MRNPFRKPEFARHFDELVQAHAAKHKNLFREGKPARGNSIATMFWRGYENAPINWDRASRDTYAYPAYKAGQAVALEAAKKEGK